MSQITQQSSFAKLYVIAFFIRRCQARWNVFQFALQKQWKRARF